MNRDHQCPTCGLRGGPRWLAAHLDTAHHQAPVAIRPTRTPRTPRPSRAPRPPRAATALPPIPEQPRDGWSDRANCHDVPKDVFYPDHQTAYDSRHTIAAVCTPCPVRGDCLSHALNNEPRHGNGIHGWWGGLSPRSLARLARDLRRIAEAA